MDFFALLISAIACVIVGLLIGWSGIAGFLLPIFFIGYIGTSSTEALTLSFFCFLISGSIGSFQYWRKGNLPIKVAITIALGSLPGAILGVYLSKWIPSSIFASILYAVVLCSGLSILLRKDSQGTIDKTDRTNKLFILGLGFITAVICALTGAGGPILVMPLLLLLGVPTRSAIGIALFDSIFIAIPAFLGYLSKSQPFQLINLLVICGVAHTIGIIIGSKTSDSINKKILKKSVAIFSIAIAAWKLTELL